MRVHDLQQAAIEAVAPRVVPATNSVLGEGAAVRRKPGAPMEAGIVMRDHAAVDGAHDEHRLLADRVLDEIAWIGHLFFTARDLPHAGPQPVHLEVEKCPRDVALLGNEAVGTD